MHKRCCLQCLPRLLVAKLCRSQLAQLVVHQRQELFGSTRVARFDSRQNLRDVSHRRRPWIIGPDRLIVTISQGDCRKSSFPGAILKLDPPIAWWIVITAYWE